MRCSAKRVTKHKVTFSFVNGSATRNLHLIRRLRRHLSRCGSGRRGSRSPPETDSLPRPCFAALKGEGKVGIVPRGSRTNIFCPNTETFSAVHNISVVCLSRLARSLGGLGGRSRIEFIVSPLSRRRHNESHFAAQSPERSFFFPLFLSRRKKKRLLAVTQSQNLCHQIKILKNPT